MKHMVRVINGPCKVWSIRPHPRCAALHGVSNDDPRPNGLWRCVLGIRHLNKKKYFLLNKVIKIIFMMNRMHILLC